MSQIKYGRKIEVCKNSKKNVIHQDQSSHTASRITCVWFYVNLLPFPFLFNPACHCKLYRSGK